MEGAFDTRMCTEGLCFSLPEELKTQLKRMSNEGQEFKSLKDVAKGLKEIFFTSIVDIKRILNKFRSRSVLIFFSYQNVSDGEILNFINS